MGQHYLIANLDRKEFIYPRHFGDGSKLSEICDSRLGTLSALALLLSQGNGQGGGDIDTQNPIVGSWAGDRIVVAGGYMEPGKFIEDATKDELQTIADICFTEGYRQPERVTLHHYVRYSKNWKDVSLDIFEAMLDDEFIKSSLTHEPGFLLAEALNNAAKTKKIKIATEK